jgi:hypothetical protein
MHYDIGSSHVCFRVNQAGVRTADSIAKQKSPTLLQLPIVFQSAACPPASSAMKQKVLGDIEASLERPGQCVQGQ